MRRFVLSVMVVLLIAGLFSRVLHIPLAPGQDADESYRHLMVLVGALMMVTPMLAFVWGIARFFRWWRGFHDYMTRPRH